MTVGELGTTANKADSAGGATATEARRIGLNRLNLHRGKYIRPAALPAIRSARGAAKLQRQPSIAARQATKKSALPLLRRRLTRRIHTLRGRSARHTFRVDHFGPAARQGRFEV